MIFSYGCESCGQRLELDFRIGKAPRNVKCDKCGEKACRMYEASGIAIVVDGHSSLSSRWGEQMRQRNTDAARRMQGQTAPKLVGYDYGGGKVVEA